MSKREFPHSTSGVKARDSAHSSETPSFIMAMGGERSSDKGRYESPQPHNWPSSPVTLRDSTLSPWQRFFIALCLVLVPAAFIGKRSSRALLQLSVFSQSDSSCCSSGLFTRAASVGVRQSRSRGSQHRGNIMAHRFCCSSRHIAEKCCSLQLGERNDSRGKNPC